MYNVINFYADKYMFAVYDKYDKIVGICDNKKELEQFFRQPIKSSRLHKSTCKNRVMLIDECVIYHIPIYDIKEDVFFEEDLEFCEMFAKPTKSEMNFNNYVKREKTKGLQEIERGR